MNARILHRWRSIELGCLANRAWAPAFSLGLAIALGMGCKHTYEEMPLGGAGSTPPRLRSESIVYVAIPPDARHKDEISFNSGTATASVIRDTFDRHVRRAYIGRHVETFDEALLTARRAKCDYLIYPAILRWADHATEFSGIRDRIELQIRIVDVATGETVHGIHLKGASRWMTDGGDKPKDLLIEPVEKYVASLFQPIYAPTGIR